jgi:hypothetical protein
MSIIYLCIANQNNKSIIGSYNPIEMEKSSLKDSIEKKALELINKINPENGPEKNRINFQTSSDKIINIYYNLINKGILYIVFVEIMSVYLDNFKDESIFELIEEIDNQGIKSNIDKSGKLNNIGKQNLKFSVEKYQNSFFAEKDFATNPSLIEEAPKDNKIAVINEQIKGVQNDMKNNVKNMVVNIQDINEMENKSSVIKDASFQFRKDSLALEKKMKKNYFRSKIILTIVIVTVLALFIYFIL